MKLIHWLHYWGYLNQIISRESILGRAKVGRWNADALLGGKDCEIGAQLAGVAGTMNALKAPIWCSFTPPRLCFGFCPTNFLS